jgi:hypothetical protein
MAKTNQFQRVANAYAKLEKAQIDFKKAVMLAAEPDDGVRLTKIDSCLVDFEKIARHPQGHSNRNVVKSRVT